TLATLLSRLGVDDDAAARYIKSDREARTLLQLRPGRVLRAEVDADGMLQSLSTTLLDGRDNPIRNLVISRDGDGFQTSNTDAAIERRIEMRTADIRSSLFAATDTA